MKFAIKASLSLVLVYLIAFDLGWDHARTSAITVMILATVGPNISSSKKALFRVLETLLGGVIGLILIGLFPQDRISYLLCVSIFIFVFLYLSRAHKGDMVLFMLSALTLLMMFDGGEVADVFTYGVNRISMIIFGIIIYTLVDIFIWPVSVKENSIDNALSLTSVESELYRERDGERGKRKELYHEMLAKEVLLNRSNLGTSDASGEMGFTTKQWHSIEYNYKKINELIVFLSRYDKMHYSDDLSSYVANYQELDAEILTLFEVVTKAWQEQKEIEIPTEFKAEYQREEIKKLSHVDHADLITTIENMQKLHTQLCKLSEKINSLISPKPTLFALEDVPRTPFFLWFDIEDIKGSIVSFLVFWTTALSWIYFNPPGTVSYGFDLVMYATALSIYTTFKPVNPLKIMMILSRSFLFAVPMYVFVLPQLQGGLELGIFIFIYAFIGFYFINPRLSIFFMFGFVTLNLDNQMSYDFSVLLTTFLLFYGFLFVLLFFYYIPFSTKPEFLFLTMKKRFFRLSQILLQKNDKLNIVEKTMKMLAVKYSKIHLMSTAKKMQFWTKFIDTEHCNAIDKKQLLLFSQECEEFAYLLKMMQDRDLQMADNPLLKKFWTQYNENILGDFLGELTLGKGKIEMDEFLSDKKSVITTIENGLNEILVSAKKDEYSKKEIIEFFENINVRKNVWLSLFSVQKMMLGIDFKSLEKNRF